MKHKFMFAVLTLLLTTGLSSAAAYADTVSFTLTDPTQSVSGTTGGTLTYDVTATASASNGAAVNLNGDSFNVASPLVLDDTDFFTDAPFFLNPGESDTFALFTITVPAGTTPDDYLGSFTIQGGADSSSLDTLGSVNFVTNVTPEPSSLLLLATGLIGAFVILKRKRFCNM